MGVRLLLQQLCRVGPWAHFSAEAMESQEMQGGLSGIQTLVAQASGCGGLVLARPAPPQLPALHCPTQGPLWPARASEMHSRHPKGEPV